MFERYHIKNLDGWGTSCRIFIGDKEDILRVYDKIYGKGKYFHGKGYGVILAYYLLDPIEDPFFDIDNRLALVFTDCYSENMFDVYITSETMAKQAIRQVALRDKHLKFNCLGKEVVDLFNAELKMLIDKGPSTFAIEFNVRDGCHMSPFAQMLFALAEKVLLTKEVNCYEQWPWNKWRWKEWWVEDVLYDFFRKNSAKIDEYISSNELVNSLKTKAKAFKEEYAYTHAPKEGGSCDELPF